MFRDGEFYFIILVINSRQEGLFEGMTRLASINLIDQFSNETIREECKDVYMYCLSVDGTSVAGREARERRSFACLPVQTLCWQTRYYALRGNRRGIIRIFAIVNVIPKLRWDDRPSWEIFSNKTILIILIVHYSCTNINYLILTNSNTKILHL